MLSRLIIMSKQIIAVDVDDVLAAEAEFVISYSNEHWGGDFTLEDYSEHWNNFWQVNHEELERRASELHQPGIVSGYRILPHGLAVLRKLKMEYELIVVTSRRKVVEGETLQWLDLHFPEIFSKLVLTGFWDDPDAADRHLLSKGSLLRDHDVVCLIDDQPKHCLGAVEHGMKAVLFGDYAENRSVDIPVGTTRCKDWLAVAEHFGV